MRCVAVNYLRFHVFVIVVHSPLSLTARPEWFASIGVAVVCRVTHHAHLAKALTWRLKVTSAVTVATDIAAYFIDSFVDAYQPRFFSKLRLGFANCAT